MRKGLLCLNNFSDSNDDTEKKGIRLYSSEDIPFFVKADYFNYFTLS